MEVAIAGASGLIGTALVASLQADGHRAVPLVRRGVRRGEDAIAWNPAERSVDRASLEGMGAVVNLAGAGLGDRRWSDEYKRVLVQSRTRTTSLLAETLASLNRPPAALVSASAIGYYGDRGDEALTESSSPGSSFLAYLVMRWEESARAAFEAGIRVAFARTSIVLSSEGGALPKLVPLFKLGLGGRMGSGRQWWSWISIDDEVAAIRFLIDGDLEGPVNLSSPHPVTNRDFTRTLARVLGRRAFTRVPAFGPKLLRGPELAQELLFTSQRVVPTALEAAGFTFSHPDLEGALRAVLDRPEA